MRSPSLASLLLSSFVGWTRSQDTSKPECATACSRDLMHYYNISTMEALCRDMAIQRELFLCLASSCTDHYGQALTHAISTCYHQGASISNLLPVEFHHTSLSPLFARSDTASFGFESRFSLSVDCKAGSDGVLTLSLPGPTPSSAGQPASGDGNSGYGNGNPNVGTNPSTGSSDSNNSSPPGVSPGSGNGQTGVQGNTGSGGSGNSGSNNGADSSGPDANCEEGSSSSGPLQPGNGNGQPQPQPQPAPGPAPPAQNPALPSPPTDSGVAGQGAPGDPTEGCDDNPPPGNNPIEASPAGSGGPVDCSVYIKDPACNSQSQPPNGLPVPAPAPAPASPPLPPPQPAPPQPAPPAVPPPSPPVDTSTPAGNGVPCGGTLGPCPGDNSNQGNKPVAPNQGALPNNGGPLSSENPSLPASPPSSSPEGQAPNGPGDGSDDGQPGATPYQSDDHDGSGSDGSSKGSDNNGGSNGQGDLGPQPPGAAPAPIQPAPAGHTASTQPQGPPAQPAPPQTTDTNFVGGSHEGPHLVTVIVPTQVESTETRIITVWPTDGPSMYSSPSQLKARAMADIGRKRQNGQEAETTETSGLDDQKEISVASSITSAPSLAQADISSGHTVSDIPFANSSNALETLLSRRSLLFLTLVTFASGLMTPRPVVQLIAFLLIVFSQRMDWL